MTQNAALDVAIGLILLYLMLSLLCTTANEYIASKLKLRAASLASGLQEILDDKDLLARFYNHGLIAGPNSAVAKTDNLLWYLTKGLGDLQAAVLAAPRGATAAVADPAAAVPPKDHPSYISSTNFASAVLGVLNPAVPIPGVADVQSAVAALPSDSKLKAVLQGALTSATADIDQVRKSLANWFDDSMERLSGAYKRDLKVISAVVGLIITVVFNADSFEIAKRLWTDSDSRALVAGIASNTSNKAPDEIRTEAQNAENLRPLPLGWGCGADDKGAVRFQCRTPELSRSWTEHLILKILGLVFTAIALTLGAPFWFDVLQKFVNIRGTGIKPERADAKTI